MNALYQRICEIATQLQQEGKTPSLALVRARAGSGIDPVKLFSAYQQWRNNPQTAVVPADAAAEASKTIITPVSNADEDFSQLRADLTRVEAKVDQILALLLQRNNHVDR